MCATVPVGVTTVTATARDNCGLQTTESFTVTVVEGNLLRIRFLSLMSFIYRYSIITVLKSVGFLI